MEFVMVFILLLPGIIASARNHRNQSPIWIISIFLNWLIIPWVCTLAWALSNNVHKER